MGRGVEYTNEFGAWWAGLAESQQDDVTAVVELLLEHGAQIAVSLLLWSRGFSPPPYPRASYPERW